MKIAITAATNDTHGQFDKRFGRAAWFCIFDDATKETTFHKNEHINAQNGAGTKAAESIISWNVQKVISGDFGPKAKELLEKFNVQMVIIQDDLISIEDIIHKLK